MSGFDFKKKKKMKTVIPQRAWQSGSPSPACNPSVPLTQGFFLTCEGEGVSILEQEPLHLASEQWEESGKAMEARERNPWGATSAFWNHLQLPEQISSRQLSCSGHLCSPFCQVLPPFPKLLSTRKERKIEA